MLVYTKSEGEYKEHDWTQTELKDWFKENVDEEGNVTDEIVLFGNSEIKAVEGSYDWVMSDYTLDRDGERVDPAGWDLKAFKKNPVLLWAHDHKTPAIGKVTSPKVKDGELTGKVAFDSDNDEFARLIEGKVKGGILSTGSVGFRSIQVEMPDQKAKDDAWLIHRKQELFEFSICNVPSNPGASRRSVEEVVEEINEVELNEVILENQDEGEMAKQIIELEQRVKALEDDKNIYRNIFKDRDETSPKDEPETRDEFEKFFDVEDTITIKELLDG